VTSYSPGLLGHDAVWRWQVSSGATWSNLPSPSGMMENIVVPTLKAFSLRAYDPKEVIIAGGDQEAVVLSPSGGILAMIELPAPPTHAHLLEDCGNVRWNIWIRADKAAWGSFLQHASGVPDSCDRRGIRVSAPQFVQCRQTQGFLV
jgi:hypothetical protein